MKDMKDFEKYYNFIKDEETKKSVKKIKDKAVYVSKNFVPAITDFINPFVARTSLPIINEYGLNFELFPSYEHSERKILILLPQFCDKINYSEYITGLRIKNKSKFKILEHKDYLGSLMSLGIDRSKTGDIYVYDDYADIIVQNDISDYIIYNLDKIAKNKIEVEKISIEEINFKEQEHVIINITSSSMRLDNIIKHITNKSRDTASSIIKSKDVKINYQITDKVTTEVEIDDLVSIRKHGRYKISKHLGITKSGKNKIEIKHYV